MPGFGQQPAGTTPAGFGSPATASSTVGDALLDRDGVRQSARYIDETTGDYVPGANGSMLGMSEAKQVVLLALKTVRDSSAVKGLGRPGAPLVVTGDVAKQLDAMYSTALADAVRRGLIEYLGFSTVKVGPDGVLRGGAVYGRLRFRDLTTGQEQEVFV